MVVILLFFFNGDKRIKKKELASRDRQSQRKQKEKVKPGKSASLRCESICTTDYV